jgi:hypothetical protein
MKNIVIIIEFYNYSILIILIKIKLVKYIAFKLLNIMNDIYYYWYWEHLNLQFLLFQVVVFVLKICNKLEKISYYPFIYFLANVCLKELEILG